MFIDWSKDEEIKARKKSVDELKGLALYLLGDYTVLKPKKMDITDFKKKVERNYRKMYGITIFSTEEEYLNDVLVGIKDGNAPFIEQYYKDPIKQNFYEIKQREYIKASGILEYIEKLPASGDDAYYIIDGKIFKGKDLKDKDRKMHKSVDFIARHKGHTIYGFQKFTEENGGAQDNQYNDVQDYAKSGKTIEDDSSLIFCVLDGGYYTSRYTKMGKGYQGTRIDYLNEEYGNGRIIAGNTDDFLKVMSNLE